MNYYCNKCKKAITRAEYLYSRRKYHRALCRRHQYTKESFMFGDNIAKILYAFSSVYERGGVGLILILIGVLLFVLTFVFQSSLRGLFFVGSIFLGTCFVILGGILLYKKEQSQNA